MQAALDRDTQIEELARENARLRTAIATMHNFVRHQWVADIEKATDRAFKHMGDVSRAALTSRKE